MTVKSFSRPLRIGPFHLKSRVLPAPMSGVTDKPFRDLMAWIGGTSCTVSEMVASEAMIRQTRQSLQKAHCVQQNSRDIVSIVQLAGTKPQVMAEAAQLAVDMGGQVIDINMGCPARKVVGCAAGSALMKDLAHAAHIIRAVVRAVSVPVTLKMRTGWCDLSRNAPELARIAENEGVQMLTVHGRTRCQFYRGLSDWRFFREVKKRVRIPVIGNGDIVTPRQAQCVLSETGVDGVMIGRGCYGRPWQPLQIHAFLASQGIIIEPDLMQKRQIVLRHLDAMLSFYGCQHGVRIARKHLAWYSKGILDGAAFRSRVNCTEEASALMRLVKEFFTYAQEDNRGCAV